ncbi:MAG: hypothetical protein ACOYNN_14650 [Terrimicrobiaceae bacterium]
MPCSISLNGRGSCPPHPNCVLYGVPWHLCPTVALHACAHVVRDGRVVGT